MFRINFISDPGKQKEISNKKWSFLIDSDHSDKIVQLLPNIKNKSIQLSNFKNHFFIFIFLCAIMIMSVLKKSDVYFQSDLVLNQVIDIIDECSYIDELHLSEAIFSKDKIKIKVRSKKLDKILSLSDKSSIIESGSHIEVFQKNQYNFGKLIFPWKIINIQDDDSKNLDSIISEMQFAKNLHIINQKEVIKVVGKSSDIISFLLQMVEKQEIGKYKLSVLQNDLTEFSLLINL